jgi:predicted acetyltransferase
MTTPQALSLRELAVADEGSATAAHRELAEEDFPFLLDIRHGEDWSEYVSRLAQWPRGEGLPEGWADSTFLIAVVGGELVGRLSLRHELTPFLAEVGGHIGYAVRPAWRRRGFASQMLSRSLPLAGAVGLTRVLVTCDSDNTASAGVIENCGGQFERFAITEQGVNKRRYWISL